MDKVVIPAYINDSGKEVPTHTIDVLSVEEMLERVRLNYANTSATLRRRVLEQAAQGNGSTKV